MITTSGNTYPSYNYPKNFPLGHIKLQWIAAFAGISLLILYYFITTYDVEIAEFYVKVFPERSYNTTFYWIDLTNLFYTELVMLTLFTLGTIYLARHINVYSLVAKAEGVVLRNRFLTLSAVVIVTFALTWYTADYILDRFPNSADEYAYVFQAETMSQGKLWQKTHPLQDFFVFEHIAQKDGKWIGRFPPGWPLLLAIAFVMGIPSFIINPILGAITLLFLYKFCARMYDERVALWSTVLTAFTACFIYNSASFFSHTASLLEAVLFAYFFYIYMDERKIHQALIAGFALGMLAITRYFTAVLVFLPFFVYLAYHHKFKSIVPLIFIGLGAVPPVLFLLWYNYSTTGNALLPVTMWAYDDESLGFVKGHTPAKGLEYVIRRIMMFIAWVSPGILILYCVYLWRKMKDKVDRFVRPEDYWLLVLTIGYFFYYHLGGNQYGPRFYYEGIPFAIILIVSTVLKTRSRWGYAILIIGFLYALVKLPIIGEHEHRVVMERQDVYDQVKKNNIQNAVVIVSDGTGIVRPMHRRELARNDESYTGDIIYAVDLEERNHELMEYYKDRKFYIYKRADDTRHGRLIEMNRNEVLSSNESHVGRSHSR